MGWGSPSPSIKVVDVPPLGPEEPVVVGKDTTDVHSSGDMGTAAAGPGPRLTLPWDPRSTDEHLDALACLTFEARSRGDQRPVCGYIGQDNSVSHTCCVPGGYPRNGQDSHWLPGDGVGSSHPRPHTIPVSRWVNLVEVPAIN